MMQVKNSAGFVGLTLIGALVAFPVGAQPSDQEDHPAISLADPAPVTEDHPSLPLLAPSLAAPALSSAPSGAPPVSAQQSPSDKVTAGISFLNPIVTTQPSPNGGTPLPDAQPTAPLLGANPPAQTVDPGAADPSKTAEAPPSDPVTLMHPGVADTAKLTADNKTILLFGIVGLSGSFADNLHGAIASDGDQVTCQAQTVSEYMCLLADGVDVAALALRNGAAQAKADAPDTYHDLETAARDERRGVWASLPPPPVHVQHPTVVNTATLTADGQTYQLDGVQGLGGQYARDFQGYILASGDSLMCNPQGDPGHYVCLLPDGTDMAKAALVNGAARVAADAPDSYRVEQGDALANKRGFWKNPPEDVLRAVPSAPSMTTAYAIASGDNGSDGITYVGGAPATIVDGQTVFIGYGGDDLGWGYWDRYHHWARASGRMVDHMNRFHPGGQGLRGYGGGVHQAVYRGGVMPGGHPGGNFIRPAPSAAFHPGGGGGFHPAPSGGGGHHR